jgi:hypothetical protein
MTSPYLDRPIRMPEQVFAELQAEITSKDKTITELRDALGEERRSAGVAGDKIVALVVALRGIKANTDLHYLRPVKRLRIEQAIDNAIEAARP